MKWQLKYLSCQDNANTFEKLKICVSKHPYSVENIIVLPYLPLYNMCPCIICTPKFKLIFRISIKTTNLELLKGQANVTWIPLVSEVNTMEISFQNSFYIHHWPRQNCQIINNLFTNVCLIVKTFQKFGPQNYKPKIWGQIHGLYTEIYSSLSALHINKVTFIVTLF